jgi:TolB-like protein/Flp pilus assembly protein TadD
MGLLSELKRRNVFRVAFAYIIVGWVVLQVAEFLAPLLNLPEWTVSFALYLGILGFPFALLFAWAFELTPEGLRRTQDVDPEASITHVTRSMLNRIIMVLMGLAILLLLLDRFLPDTGSGDEAKPTTPADPVAEEAAPEKPKSIAVLPFVNMSNDKEQEYFSDGISEELLNALTKIRDLRVAARTSSFAFKGKNQDITQIGNALNVEAILEGSVRKSGQRLRITAQLINVADGYHLWSETYDRDLTDIFAIQDEISAAIVSALKIHLIGDEITTKSKAVDLEAYNFFLLGRHSLRRRTEASLQSAVKQYQKAIDIEPTYAEAWVGKATATALLSEDDYGQIPHAVATREAQSILDMAFALDANSGAAHATQSLLYMDNYRPQDSLQSLQRAIALIPNEGILYSWQFNAYSALGNYNAALASLEQAYKIDPLHHTIRHNLVMQYGINGKTAKAREMVATGSETAYELEAEIAFTLGHWADVTRAYTQAIERAEGGYNYRNSFIRSLYYFFNLKNAELARQDMTERTLNYYQAVIDPVGLLESNSQSDFSAMNIIRLTPYLIAMIRTDACEQVIEILHQKDFANTPLYGAIDGTPGYALLAQHYAYCLKTTGRQQQASALARRILAYIEAAVANGEQPYYFDFLALTQMLLGDEDAAMGSLRLAWQYYDLSWVMLSSPQFAPLRSREEFRELSASVQKHTNAERAKLGWEPIEL